MTPRRSTTAKAPADGDVRAAIYTRLSRDQHGDQLGVQRQERDCRHLCKSKGWKAVDVFTDDDVSAYVPGKRPEYRRMLDAIATREVDAVVVYDLDRLHRHPAELETFFAACDTAGLTRLASVAGDVDLASNDGRLIARIMGAVAKKSSDDASRRIRRKRDELAEQGKPHGGRRAFGYDADGVTVNADEAALVRDAAKRVLAGVPVSALAREWTARGVPGTQGATTWGMTTIRQILVSPRVAGLRVHRGEVVGKASWKAILDRATHERLVAMFADPSRRRPAPGGRSLLTGFLTCGRCGAHLVSDRRRGQGGASPGDLVWRCKSGAGRSGCGRIVIAAAPVEHLVVEALLLRLDGPGVARAMKRSDGRGDDRADSAEVAGAEKRLADLAETWAEGAITRAEWLHARRAVEERLHAARARLTRRTGTEALRGFEGGLRASWETLDNDRRRAVIAAVIDRIAIAPATRMGRVFDPSRVDIEWRV